MSKRKSWFYGKEVEGRLYGLETVFLAEDFRKIKKVAKKFGHALIGVSLIDQLIDGYAEHISWGWIESYIDKGNFITLEATPCQISEIPQAIRLKAHILLWIDVPELDELKSSDSVKLCTKNHDMYVYTLHNGQRVTRNDYYHDRYDK